MPILAAYKIVCTINKNEPTPPPPPRGVARGRELEQTCRRGEIRAYGQYIITRNVEKRPEFHGRTA